MTKRQQFSAWMKKHSDEITLGALYVGATVATIVTAVLVYKTEEAQNEAYANQQQMIADAISRGSSVIPGPDGGYWIINNQSH